MQIQQFKDQLTKDGILLVYSGPWTQEMVEEVGGALKKQIEIKMKLAGKIGRFGTISKVFSIFIEQGQNIVHYSEERLSSKMSPDFLTTSDTTELRHGIIIIGFQSGKYYVHCGNIIKASDGPRLMEKLLRLQGMSKDELKDYYKQRRKSSPEKGSQGAGLGFIEMARKCENFTFEIAQTDADYAFFSLKVFIV